MALVETSQDVSGLLLAWSGGDTEALKTLVPLVYPDLRQIARQHMRRQRVDHTLESAALVNEAYLKLFQAKGLHCGHRAHFFAVCAQIIRRILVDHARHNGSAKNGGNVPHVALDEKLLGSRARGVALPVLDDALSALALVDDRKAKVVELRYFGGLTIQESAEVLRVSEDTVLRDWKMAKVWLLREMEHR